MTRLLEVEADAPVALYASPANDAVTPTAWLSDAAADGAEWNNYKVGSRVVDTSHAPAVCHGIGAPCSRESLATADHATHTTPSPRRRATPSSSSPSG